MNMVEKEPQCLDWTNCTSVVIPWCSQTKTCVRKPPSKGHHSHWLTPPWHKSAQLTSKYVGSSADLRNRSSCSSHIRNEMLCSKCTILKPCKLLLVLLMVQVIYVSRVHGQKCEIKYQSFSVSRWRRRACYSGQTNLWDISNLGCSLTAVYHRFWTCSPFHSLLSDGMQWFSFQLG